MPTQARGRPAARARAPRPWKLLPAGSRLILHLDPGGIHGRALTSAEERHLASCARCRIALRLHAGFAEEPASALPGDRYLDLGLLGRGGMGEVRKVHDRVLGRDVALKLLPADGDADRATRFAREASLTAGLQHPGVAPVFDYGTLPDGRPWYTMRIVTGDTLAAALARRGRPAPTEHPDTRRLVEVVLRVAEAVAYAHERGVLHRDLKPANVMFGEFGEVIVIDWGLARRVGDPLDTPRSQAEGPVGVTIEGTVAGTVAYMAPEQARGEVAALGPPADAWALGAMLYEVLAGVGVYASASPSRRLARAREGVVDPPPPGLPPELEALLGRALAPSATDRFADAGALAAALRAWLDGAWRRDRAIARVTMADQTAARIAELRSQADTLAAAAREHLAPVRPADPVERKRAGWAEQDAARRLGIEADDAELAFVEHLRGALAEVPDLPEARTRLADHYAARHAAAEAAHDEVRAGFLEKQLRAVDDGRHAGRLRAEGTVEVCSDPPGAEVVARRYTLVDRRLVPGEPVPLGRTPLEASLPAGSWLLTLHVGHGGQGFLGDCTTFTEGFAPEPQAVQNPASSYVLLPVFVERGALTRALRPGATAPTPVPLGLGLGPDDRLVAAGWFVAGGDPEATSSLPRRRLWADAFVIRRDPVTNAEFLAFLDALVAGGREEEALRHAPRERSGTFGEQGRLIYGRRPDGRFELVPDADGDRWAPDWPVINVAFDGAMAFAEWRSALDDVPWRLPTELEWEKAARGGDGRAFPWGEFLDPTWANVRETHLGRSLPSPVDAFPVDESPWGVRGMAGNVRDRCADLLAGPSLDGDVVGVARAVGEGSRTLKGGSYGDVGALARAATRTGVAPEVRGGRIGFRLVRSV